MNDDSGLIERIAVRLHDLKHGESAKPWADRPEGAKDVWRDLAREIVADVRGES